MNLRKDNKKKKPMQLMLDEISGMMGVSQEMILSRMISRNISDSRMLFCYMAYEEGYLFREIASFLKISRCRATTAYYGTDMSELYIPPERFERDFITGRFLKGCVSRNKGRKMVYHSKRSKARSIKNLSKGRGAWHKTGAGMNKKSVVLIKDEKLCGVFPSIQMAGKMIGVAPSLISAICRKVRGKHTANGYRCFFEDSNDWYNLIKQDYE